MTKISSQYTLTASDSAEVSKSHPCLANNDLKHPKKLNPPSFLDWLKLCHPIK